MAERNEQWEIAKPVARSEHGVVAAQNWRAADVGVEVLRAGGNAVDAAVATAFALGVVEPWMSGIGGGGYMMVYLAAEKRVEAIDFAMIAPRALDPADYPLIGGDTDSDLFGWPAVEGNRNVAGPLSIAAPGTVDGLGLALERFGSMSWAELIAPAIALARQGHPVDWWTTLKVAGEAKDLQKNEAAAATYLPDGLPPAAPEDNSNKYLPLGALTETLERLAKLGRREYYEGELARGLVADVQAAGGRLAAEDLSDYHANLITPRCYHRGEAEIHLLPGLNAGPTFAEALEELPAIGPGQPDADAYAGYARSLSNAYQRRFETMGHDGDSKGQGSTTHFSVMDRAGNMVTCTNTLLSLFGSKVLAPQSGVMLNNGVMWFDPRPGRPNSIAPGQRPLSNMCPAVVTRDGEPWFALGASGGRRILPAVYQMVSLLADCRLSLEEAVMTPRLNIDGGAKIQIDLRLPEVVQQAVAAVGPAEAVEAKVAPNFFANPQVVLRDGAECQGAAQPRAPLAAARGL